MEPSRAAASPGEIEDTTNVLPARPESNSTDNPIPTPCALALNL